jgi:SOUL heme-binding protein
MTAPVAIEGRKPTALAMTAPVVIEQARKEAGRSSKNETMEPMKMQFFLPAEYDSLSKIPRPTNPNVSIHEVPPAVGAVHRYSGTLNMAVARDKARALALQLQHDGLDNDNGESVSLSLKTEHVIESFQYWGYNPPFTIPMFRRNEIWVPLTEEQVALLLSKQHVEKEDSGIKN